MNVNIEVSKSNVEVLILALGLLTVVVHSNLLCKSNPDNTEDEDQAVNDVEILLRSFASLNGCRPIHDTAEKFVDIARALQIGTTTNLPLS